MNRFLLHIILFFILPSLVGQQNLVPNGSFEEYSECPTLNELNNGQFERAIGWFRPTQSTPDFMHRCNNNIVSIPTNFLGYQEPYHGDGYASFAAISWLVNDDFFENEYMRIKLYAPLKPCVEYHFRMFVSLCDFSNYGVGKIGGLFTIEDTFSPTYGKLEGSPQIIYQGLPITDTIDWTKVEGVFVANGLEQYLTIGYFRDSPNMDTVLVQNGVTESSSFYYIDSISLYELEPVPEELCEAGEVTFPNIISPNNDNSNDQINASPYFSITDEIVILNRWGNVITTLKEDNPIWDGTNRDGKACSEGNYFYTFTYQWGTQTKEKSGFIQLVR